MTFSVSQAFMVGWVTLRPPRHLVLPLVSRSPLWNHSNTASVFCILHWLITSYYKIKCIPKFICSWIKIPTNITKKKIKTIASYSFHFLKMFIIFMEGRISPERVEFISVAVCYGSSCPYTDLKGFPLSKFGRKTFPSYSSSALYVPVPGYCFSIIW